MSNDKWGENPHRRKPKGSAARIIRGGLVGPKPRPQGVGDGQQVDSPVPPIRRLSMRDAEGRLGGSEPSKLVGRLGNPVPMTEASASGHARPASGLRPERPRKA